MSLWVESFPTCWRHTIVGSYIFGLFCEPSFCFPPFLKKLIENDISYRDAMSSSWFRLDEPSFCFPPFLKKLIEDDITYSTKIIYLCQGFILSHHILDFFSNSIIPYIRRNKPQRSMRSFIIIPRHIFL